jgi:hypothetical protein
MDIENLIKETFTAHEHVAPDADTVLATTRRRIEKRHAVLIRPLAVAAGVAVLTLAAVTVVALNRPVADDAAAPAGKAPAVANLTMPYSLHWLPPGSVAYGARRINMETTSNDPNAKPLYSGEYMLTVTTNRQVLDVDVQHMRMIPLDQAAFKSGPGSPVTINGQRGVESSRSGGPGGYELYVEHPGGGSMYVNVGVKRGSRVPAKQLAAFGRRIAENVRFPGTTAVTPEFGLRDLPEEMRVCAFDVEQAIPRSYTSYSLGTCSTTPTIVVTAPVTDVQADTPGRPVLGHETRYTDENGYRTLWVLDAVDDAPVTVAGRVPPADLYDIANRLVLPR